MPMKETLSPLFRPRQGIVTTHGAAISGNESIQPIIACRFPAVEGFLFPIWTSVGNFD